MKIGNIKEIVSNIAENWKHIKIDEEDYDFDLARAIKGLPKKHLEDWFQQRYNKHLDYDQWVGIRDELDGMGYRLYESTLGIIGDAILVVRHEDQKKIENLEGQVKEMEKEIGKLKEELKKYID